MTMQQQHIVLAEGTLCLHWQCHMGALLGALAAKQGLYIANCGQECWNQGS